MLKLRLLAVAAAMTIPALAGAQTTSGVYIAGAAGLNLRDAIDISHTQYLSSIMGTPAQPRGPAYIDNRIGYAVVAAVG